MKKYVTIALFIFWAAVVAILVAGLVFYQDRSGAAKSAAGQPQVENAKQRLGGKMLDAAEVARHGSAGDCWMILSGKVYDFTGYLNSHPGGAKEIIKACGSDGTVLYQTKDNRGSDHSARAYQLLASYYLGDLGQKMAEPQAAKAGLPAAATSATPAAQRPVETPSAAPAVKPGGSAVVLSSTEVAKHNRASDCWMIISGKIYNLTSYLNSHPGGAAIIIQACGQDGSALYRTKGGGGGNHSGYAYGLLANYLVGTLGEQKTPAQIQQLQQQSQAASQNLPAGGGEDD